jgi:hypothetical protein
MDKYISSIEKTFEEVQQDYNILLPILKDSVLLKKCEDDCLIDISDISYIATLVSDLAVQLQDIRLKIESSPIFSDTQQNTENSNNPLLPLILLYAMKTDKDSLLNSKTFGKKEVGLDIKKNYKDEDPELD